MSELATLDGTLEVALINGFVPAPGDAFEILTFGSVSGQFADAEGLYGFGDGKNGHRYTRWDSGTYQLESETSGEIVARLDGQRLSGHLRLTRPDAHSPAWQFELRPGSTAPFSGGPTRSLDGLA